MKKFIGRGATLLVASVVVAMMAFMGTGIASADSLIGKTYADAKEKISGDWGSTPVVSTVAGDQMDLDSCIVSSWRRNASVDALTGDSNKKEVLVNLNCNAKVAQAGVPGNSAMTPQGKAAKQDIKVANQINEKPDFCYKSDDNLAYCKRVCNRTGLCEADSL